MTIEDQDLEAAKGTVNRIMFELDFDGDGPRPIQMQVHEALGEAFVLGARLGRKAERELKKEDKWLYVF